MDINPSSETYKRYAAGYKSCREFFGRPLRSTPERVGFCSMMRTIYFWRPFIVMTRITLMSVTILVGPVIAYLNPTDFFPGLVVVFLALCAMAAAIALITGVIIAPEYITRLKIWPGVKEDSQIFLLRTWFKAGHDKMCPLVEFKGEVSDDQSR